MIQQTSSHMLHYPNSGESASAEPIGRRDFDEMTCQVDALVFHFDS